MILVEYVDSDCALLYAPMLSKVGIIFIIRVDDSTSTTDDTGDSPLLSGSSLIHLQKIDVDCVVYPFKTEDLLIIFKVYFRDSAMHPILNENRSYWNGGKKTATTNIYSSKGVIS